jgi:molybdenum cofactor cytidylyltransferase
MGQPKLLLPLAGKTVIARLLETLDRPQIACRAVVVRQDDEALRMEVETSGGWVIAPEHNPREMRQSVEYALSAIRERFSPRPTDGWLLVPADHPVISVDVIDSLMAAWQLTSSQILVPTCQHRRGHPTIFSWELAERVPKIPKESGLNWLARHSGASLEEVPVEDPAIFTDLDTPSDYETLKNSFPTES